MRRMISVVCAEQSDIDSVLLKTESSDIEGYHLDVVDKDIDNDGNFRNELFTNICMNSKKITEFHLLLDDVYSCIRSICLLKPDYIYISSHCKNIDEIYKIVKNADVTLGFYFESGMIIESGELDRLSSYSTHFMILTVEPRSIGGTWLPFAKQNINIVLQKGKNIELELDGGCSKDVINYYNNLGIKAFVFGSKSGFFDEFHVKKGVF